MSGPAHLSGRAIGYACLISGLIGDGFMPAIVMATSPTRHDEGASTRGLVVRLVLLASHADEVLHTSACSSADNRTTKKGAGGAPSSGPILVRKARS